MVVLNPNFEDAGALPGEAANWTFVAVTHLERIAAFGSPPAAQEDFERWFEAPRAFEDITSVLAFFDAVAEGAEDFEEGWNGGVYLIEMPSSLLSEAQFGAAGAEDLEAGWANDAFVSRWSALLSQPADFSGEPVERFEGGWNANEVFLWSWNPAIEEAMAFDGATNHAEGFTGPWDAAATI